MVKKIITGETSILRMGDVYYYYVNNWGGCASVDCCASKGGCASCCYVPPTAKYPDACVFTSNHSVYAYKTVDFQHFENLGIVLNVSSRPKGIEFRPHVVSPRPGFFVMWFENRPSPIQSSGYSIAVSASPAGPFETKFVNVDVSGITPGDFDILYDEETRQCWHLQTTTNDPKLLRGFVLTELDSDCVAAKTPKNSKTFQAPKPAEGPVFFKRGGKFYILAGTTCCACRGGSSIYVFSASSPLSKWEFLGDIGANRSHAYDPHSPYNYVTRAQASTVFQVPDPSSGEIQYVWLGNQWTSSPQRNTDLTLLVRLAVEIKRRAESIQSREECNTRGNLNIFLGFDHKSRDVPLQVKKKGRKKRKKREKKEKKRKEKKRKDRLTMMNEELEEWIVEHLQLSEWIQ